MYPSNLGAFPPDASPGRLNFHYSHMNLFFRITVDSYPP
jgi:hypothetical protein